MTSVAYIANEFPSPLEPYVMDEITELRRHGVQVVCYSGKRVAPDSLTLSHRAFWRETHFCQPLSDEELLKAAGRLVADPGAAWGVIKPLAFDPTLPSAEESEHSATRLWGQLWQRSSRHSR